MTYHHTLRARGSARAIDCGPPERRPIGVLVRRGSICVVSAGLAFGVIAAPAAAIDPDPEEAASTATTVSSSSSDSAIVDVARQYVGTPYVWGGATPAAFDCSGFTMHVFAEVGIELPRTSAEQRYAGQVVPAADARPGDLVWWPGHVGIYTGNGQHIAARSPSTLLHESPIWRADPTFIRVD